MQDTHNPTGIWLRIASNGGIETSRDLNQHWITEGQDDAILAYFDINDLHRFGAEAIEFLRTCDPTAAIFFFLLDRIAPPHLSCRNDGEVKSFACPIPTYRLICEHHHGIVAYSCYQAAKAMLDTNCAPARMQCLQLPVAAAPDVDPEHQDARCEWIIPHAGNLNLLHTCLASVVGVALPLDQVSICFDEAVSDPHHALASRFPAFRYLTSSPCGYGPYVARQHLSLESKADYLLFQDSDDVPCVGRRSRLEQELRHRQLDWVGSHELQVNELTRQVLAFRFPLNVTQALRDRPAHPLLFPTSMIRQAAFARTGGFSTHRTFGSDTEFLLRSYFLGVTMGNADEFLYVRRKRPGSLTTNPATALGGPVRLALDKGWKIAFAAIKRGKLELAQSALRLVQHDHFDQIKIKDMAA